MSHISRELNEEDSGNWVLLYKHSDFNNTTDCVCTATTPISPFLLRDSLPEGGKTSVYMRVYVPPLGLCKNPSGLGYLIDSVLQGCLEP